MENTIKQEITKTKSFLCGLQDVKKSFETVSSNIKREVEYIQSMHVYKMINSIRRERFEKLWCYPVGHFYEKCTFRRGLLDKVKIKTTEI